MKIVNLTPHDVVIVNDNGEGVKRYLVSVYVPDTGHGSVVRDDKGQIIGVKRLMQL